MIRIPRQHWSPSPVGSLRIPTACEQKYFPTFATLERYPKLERSNRSTSLEQSCPPPPPPWISFLQSSVENNYPWLRLVDRIATAFLFDVRHPPPNSPRKPTCLKTRISPHQLRGPKLPRRGAARDSPSSDANSVYQAGWKSLLTQPSGGIAKDNPLSAEPSASSILPLQYIDHSPCAPIPHKFLQGSHS